MQIPNLETVFENGLGNKMVTKAQRTRGDLNKSENALLVNFQPFFNFTRVQSVLIDNLYKSELCSKLPEIKC